MELHQVIIHELQKEGGITRAVLISSNTLMDTSNLEVINLVKELNNRYKTKNENYGVFDDKSPTRFHKEFNTYRKESTEETFISFTKQVSADLREKVNSVAPAKGGYLVYAHYTDQREFLGIFLVRDTKGTAITRTRSSQIATFDIAKVEHIDFEKMAMACRINIKAFDEKIGRYLSFINKKSDAISKYFSSWISTTDTESNQQDTLYLYKILKQMDPPKDEQGNAVDRDVFLDAVYRHVNATFKNQINIRDLSREFYQNEELISAYAETQSIPINTEFKVHPGAFKRFIQIRAKADHIELAFQHQQLNSVVRIVGTNQIIIDSVTLVDKIKQQLAGDE
jgi:nucleoid-associated protein